MKRMTVLDVLVVMGALTCLILLTQKESPTTDSAITPYDITTGTLTTQPLNAVVSMAWTSTPSTPKATSILDQAEGPQIAPRAEDSVAPLNLAATNEPKLRELESKIDILKRQIDDVQFRLDSDQVKAQLNTESLPASTREIYFGRLKDLASLRREVIELRFKKIELLQSMIKPKSQS